MKKHHLFLLFALLTGVRCGTDVGEIDTTVIVRVSVQTNTAPRDTIYTADWDAFYFYADTIRYAAPTLEDVRAKRLRARSFSGDAIPAEITPDGTAEVLDTTRVRFNHLRQKAILVIYRPDFESYAWRPVELVDGLPELWFTVPLKLWQTTTSYQENKWIVVLKKNPEPDSPPDE